MNPQQLALYQKIQAFALDKPNVSFTYTQRLARDHQWSLDYSQRVIEEYKKFLFLAIAAGHPVTPSVAVDEAWHLHLTYTHSYWDELCGQVLEKPLHHNPTQGGIQQRELFWNCYAQTLESYHRFFGCPPSDIWPSPTHRFNQQIRQINQQDYWLIPKPSLMNLSQILERFSHKLWLKGMAIALLTLGLVLSLSFAINLIDFLINQPVMAQVSSSSHPHQTNFFSTLQLLGLCLVGSGISFLIGAILSLQPIFIHPVGRTRVISDVNVHQSIIDKALRLSSFLLITPFLTIILKTISFFFYDLFRYYYFSHLSNFFDPSSENPDLVTLLGVIFYFICVLSICSMTYVILGLICATEEEFITQLSRNLKNSFCIHCRKKLKKIASVSSLLTEQEKIAQEIGSTTFEAWHCQNCYPEINLQSIHLRIYRNTSDRFKECPVCQEMTMKKSKSSKILQEATTTQEGKELITYTCHCCHKQEETIKITPQEEVLSCSGCGGCAD